MWEGHDLPNISDQYNMDLIYDILEFYRGKFSQFMLFKMFWIDNIQQSSLPNSSLVLLAKLDLIASIWKQF